MVSKSITVLRGDGIGPEIMKEGLKALDAISIKYGHQFHLTEGKFGAGSYFEVGNCYPTETKDQCLSADAVLKGPVGLNRDGMRALQEKGIKLENAAILPLRGDLDTYCCYRPVFLPKSCADFSSLKPEVIGEGIDIMMMRELVGGLYFGAKVEAVKGGVIIGEKASDPCDYTVAQIERFAHACFREAQQQGCQLTNVSKPNVLATGRLWDAVFRKVKSQYASVPFNEGIVDDVAFKLAKNPRQFNGVMALENMQGDILTDLGGGIIGSLGLMPSACVNPETGRAYYEPSHGSAPDIAGKNIANPYSMIGCIAFMLDKSFGLKQESQEIWAALTGVFAQGFRTQELATSSTPLEKIISTSQFGDLVVKNILADKK